MAAHSLNQHSTSLAGIIEQRRGILLPKKNPLVENIGLLYPPPPSPYVKQTREVSRKLSCLDKVLQQDVSPSSKGKALLETRFPASFHGCHSARFSQQGNLFVLAYGTGQIQVWYTEEECSYVNVRSPHPIARDPVTCIRFLPNDNENRFLASTASGSILICGISAEDWQVFAQEKANEINAMDVNLLGDTVVTGGKDASLRLYDTNTKKLKAAFCRDNDCAAGYELHTMRICAVKFHPMAEDVFLSGGWDDYVKIWDARTDFGHVRDIKGPHIRGDALDMQDERVLTGSWRAESSLQLWDFASGRLITNINPANRPITIDGNTVVAGGSGLGCLEVIEVGEMKVISTFHVRKAVRSLDTSLRHLIFGGMENAFRVATLW